MLKDTESWRIRLEMVDPAPDSGVVKVRPVERPIGMHLANQYARHTGRSEASMTGQGECSSLQAFSRNYIDTVRAIFNGETEAAIVALGLEGEDCLYPAEACWCGCKSQLRLFCDR